MSEEEIKPEIKSIKDLLDGKEEANKLTIPDYQRPYKWQTNKHVLKLLEDIEEHRKQAEEKGKQDFRYRIGTIVIHKDKDKDDLNIVDGQQRITTLVLILKALKQEQIKYPNFLYNHKTSQYNIYHNYQAIKSFISGLGDDKKQAFCDFLLERCEVVYIVLSEIDEAFQFFDSQNARGKPLEAYDLLKAFHLREMGEQKTYEVSEKEKRRLVHEWEEAANHRFLKAIFDDLYAIRMWLRGERTAKTRRGGDARDFTDKNVDHFKGINIEKFYYPYLKKNAAPDFYFAIDREIFNGSLFFNYILHYVEMYKEIFCYKKDGNKYEEKFLDSIDYDIIVENLKGNGIEDIGIKKIYTDGRRTRFVFVRMLFRRVLLFYYDKFGDNDFDEAVKKCFKWSGELLKGNKRLVYSAIQNKANDKKSLFQKIKYALKHTEITGN